MKLLVQKKGKKIFLSSMAYIVSTILCLVWLVPLVIAIFTSMKELGEIMTSQTMWAPPTSLNFTNFSEVWATGNFSMYIPNTIIITAPSLIFTLFLSSLAAYALAIHTFKGSNIIFYTFIGGMLIPFQMLLIPVYRFSQVLGIYDTRIGVILFHIAFQIGFCSFFLRNFMKSIPTSIIQSARVDGAKDFLIYRKLILPLCSPAIAALATLEFTWIWNDYLWSLILIQSDRIKPITLGIATLRGQWITSYENIAAAGILAMAAPIIIFLLFQRYFIQGLTTGAVKG